MTKVDTAFKFESPYFAAIDLGSNSFHMIVVRIDDQQMEIIDREKEMIQIAKGISSDGNLSAEAQLRATQCLTRFAERLRDIPAPQIRAVGTKTLRSVKNANQFLTQAENALGTPIQIISGYEEARLVYAGFAHCVSHDHNQRLVVDIGGGSTEFIVGVDYEPHLLESLPLGCVTYTDRFINKIGLTKQGMRSAYLSASAEIESIRKRYCDKTWVTAHGTSGTIKAIAELLANEHGNAKITSNSLNQLYEHIGETGQLPSNNLSQTRQDVLPAGIAILKAVFDQLRLSEIFASTATLKEGLLYDTIGRFSNHDTRHATIEKLQERYSLDVLHAENVEKLAVTIWKSINALPVHGVSRTKILRWAAMVHEIGINISHSSYHNHGFYILKHSDLAGFGRYEQYMLSSLVRGHRKKISAKTFQNMDSDTQKAVLPVLACLRIAVVLLRRREKIDTDVKIQGSEKIIQLTFDKNWLTNNPLTQASLKQEIHYLAQAGMTLSIQ